MYCRNCGKEIKESSVFCRYCGAQVRRLPEQLEPQPSAPEPADAPLRKKTRGVVIAVAVVAVVAVVGAAVGGVMLARDRRAQQEELQATQEQLEQAQADIAEAQEQLEEAQADAAQAEQDRVQAEQERAQAQAQAEAAAQQAGQAQDSGSDVRRQAEAELTRVEAQSAQLETLFDNARDQSELNRYSGELFKLWDDEINVLWGHLEDAMQESDFDALTEEQVDWIVDKEAAIDKAGSEVSGGSMEPMVRSLTGYEWTRERVYYLMDYLP